MHEHVALGGLSEAHVAEEAHLRGNNSRGRVAGGAHPPWNSLELITSSCSRTKARVFSDERVEALKVRVPRGFSLFGQRGTKRRELPAWKVSRSMTHEPHRGAGFNGPQNPNPGIAG